MTLRRASQFLSLLLMLCFSLLITGCGSNAGNSKNAAGVTYEVSPSFREFYQKLGGESQLGPAISEDFNFQSNECQYTVNALMCMSPSATDANRFTLYPLGLTMNVREDPTSGSTQESSRVVNGYNIYDEFVTLYDQLGGTKYVGNPLTQVRLNYSQQRIEQYFENVGFYRRFSDPPGQVHLLAYGAFSCDAKCKYSPSVDALVINSSKAVNEQPFLPSLGRMGGTTVFGNPLTQPYIAADGYEEQVYENAVIYAPAGNTTSVKLRPLPLLLGMVKMDPGVKKYSSQDGMVFYPTNGELGYHVPVVFDRFIASHGGLEISGNPIAEVVEYSAGVYRQCFENYCLDYITGAPEDEAVKLAPLGKQYLDQLQSQSARQPLTISPETVTLQVSEQYKQLSPDSPQQITILVTNTADQKPLPNFEANLDITLPDNSHYTADFPATQSDGKSSLTVPAMADIPNGSILSYRVCLKAASTRPVCNSGSYLIWNTP